ncbi:glycoside hydrolase family 31 protein [Bifidobacterium psychraerophilum]|uniref:glycoside hydrolase family 31 protein n=1 Tax=Bifidobacterium psychraerophilum TaxID=218140 RepID=UPI0031189CD0
MTISSYSNPRFTYPSGAHPLMDDAYVITGDHWRIGVLTESLVRLEWSEDGAFEDHCSQTVINRDVMAGKSIDMHVYEQDDLLVIETPALHLSYDRRPFSKEGLQIRVKGMDGYSGTWHYGFDQHANLKGTARTLDGADGAIELGEGLISRDGWSVIDDSKTNILTAEASCVQDGIDGNTGHAPSMGEIVRIMPRPEGRSDLYFFGYGHRFSQAIKDFYKLTGPTPLLPRFALGNWWSRYYRYSADEYLGLMDRFEKEGLPFTTSVIDMDWHLTDIPEEYGSGWTGYTWDPELFPDPQGFLAKLHEKGMHVTLNVHPRDGVRAFERAYRKMALSMGVDPDGGEAIEFDLTNPKFVDAYFDMHHDLEEEGVDFWWIDWQQGGLTKQVGLDPLWMLNHLHYLDSARDGRWPLTFSRYAGPGSHRYPVGFSGDTVVSWRSLRFQPYFTATASNIGYGWWSHDIGGHMEGVRDEELEARWYQLGTFSPINRLHSSASPFNGKEPWNFHEPVRSAMVKMLRTRQTLLPYLYTMNWRNAAEGEELIEPMYWQYPEQGEAYAVPNEYFFGSELIAAPITEAVSRDVMRAKAKVWLPQGQWFDFFTGRRYDAEAESGLSLYAWRGIDSMPVFAKAGGIVPLQSDACDNAVGNPEALDVLVFPGADGSFTMREDDGIYAPGGDLDAMHAADTTIRFDAASSTLTIGKATGVRGIVPEQRHWTLVFRGAAPVTKVLVNGAPYEGVTYDDETLSIRVPLDSVPTGQEIEVAFPDGLALANDPVEQDIFSICMDAQIAYPLKEKAHDALRRNGVRALPGLRTMTYQSRDEQGLIHEERLEESVISALEEVLVRN